MKQERQFGYGVGGVLALLGGLLVFWRHRTGAGLPLLALGGSLVLFAALAPRVLSAPARAWSAFSHALGRMNTVIFLSVLFLLVLTPLGLVLRLLGRDPLRRRRISCGSMWVPYAGRTSDPKHFERMF